MDKFQAAFEILYICSSIDGEIDESELDVIINFLESNQDSLEFNPKDLIDDLDLLNTDGKIEEFIRASHTYNTLSSAKEKRILLDFIVKVIESDGKVMDEEMALLVLLADISNIDLEKYFK